MDNVSKAKQLMLWSHPFYATILLNHRWVVKPEVGTMGTTGKTMYYNPEWTDSLPIEELKGVLAHECMHVAFQHSVRLRELSERLGTDMEKAHSLHNLACDFVINAHLIAEHQALPSGGATPEGWEDIKQEYGIESTTPLTKMTSEQVFDLLMQHLPPQDGSGGEGEGGGDTLPDGSANHGKVLMCEGDTVTEAADAASLVLQAATTAKQAGNIPGWAEEIVGALNQPKVDWRSRLWRFMTEARKTGYSFTRPNRRYTMSNIAMPSIGSKGMPAINVVIDSSGSVSGEEFTRFLSELNGAAQAMNIRDVLCVVCDTKVQAVHHRSVSEGEITFNNVGRGGTYLGPAFEELQKHRPAPTICFTDGYFHVDHPLPPQMFWCTSTGQVPSGGIHGEVVHVEV